MDLVKQYDTTLERGVPTLVVLDSNGKVLFAQKKGEFESQRKVGQQDLIDFLNTWKP